MRKLVLFFAALFMITTGISFANDITDENYLSECRIGSLGLNDSFDMNQLNETFGKMSKPAIQGGASTEPIVLFFDNARVVVINNDLYVIDVTSNVGANGEPLKTPRGVSVGSDIDTVFRLYGAPYRIYKYQDEVSYSYGNYEHNLVFTTDPNNKIIEISAGRPTC